MYSYEIKGGEWLEDPDRPLIRKFSNKKLAEYTVRQLNAAYGRQMFTLESEEMANDPDQFDFSGEVYEETK